MTELSSPSLVSTISAESVSVHRPRPPNAPKPSTKPFTARRSKIVQSPYLTTSTPKKVTATDQQKWAHVSSVAWSNPTFNSETLMQTLMKLPDNSLVPSPSVSKKRKRSYSTVAHTPGAGDPFEASREDLQEELQGVKRELKALTHERNVLQARVRRMEEEMGQKDKQIEELLASGAISSSDAVRVVSGGKTEVFISSLRHKVHTLQVALREKEKEVATLHQDMRSTRLKEVETASEVYYGEVCRLQKLLEHLCAECRGPSPQSYREAQTKARALEEGVARLSQELEEAKSDNRRLREELGRALEKPTQWTGHSEKGYRGSLADKYADLDRAKMLSTIVDFELRVQESSKTIQSLCSEFDEKKSAYEGRLAEANGKHAEATRTLEELKEKGRKAEETQEKLRGTIKKLKEDRTHYRALAEQLQSQLAAAGEQLHSLEASHTSTQQELVSLRQIHQDELMAREHAQKLASHRAASTTSTRAQQEGAAAVIQRSWRRRRARVKQTHFQEALGRAVLQLQGALRAHMTRRRALEVAPLPPSAPPTSSSSSSPDSLTSVSSEGLSEESERGEGGEGGEESDLSARVEMIQSALRAYQSRRMAMLDLTTNVTLFNEEDTSGDDSFTTTSLDEITTSSVVSNACSSSNHMRSSASAPLQPLDEPHPPNPACPTPRGLLLPMSPVMPRPQAEASPPDKPRPQEQTRPFSESHSQQQRQPSSKPTDQTMEPYASTQPPPLDAVLQEKGVEAWRTLDCASGVHVVTSSMVDYTSPPPRPRLPEDPHHHPHETHSSLKISRASRRCGARSAGKGSLHSRSMQVLGNAKLYSKRSQSAHQITVESSSSEVEEVLDSPEKVLLTEELS